MVLIAQVSQPRLAPSTQKPVERWAVIHAGTLMADADKPVQHNVSIVVHNDKVDSSRSGRVGPEVITGAPEGSVTVIDLGDRFVMAGLIDGSFSPVARAAR